ncbi:hypothetical protein BUZ67_01410 [Staphylococcus pasteuri]|nr:hypothetical protein BUZ66_02740 [Staphylococcus pasteuri]PTU86582.1 hypothetical protein BUZ67_01410 [Staphylococcus pasteuri]RIO37679.1 hypothetical protein BUZ65_01960 [Staphylococcus pasteuri]
MESKELNLPKEYYDDRDNIHKRIREVDEKHTTQYNTLHVLLTETNTTMKSVAETNRDIKDELVITNSHLSNQDKRISKVESDVEYLEEDNLGFKKHLEKEQELAQLKGKENRDFILKLLTITIGGGGAAWLLKPLFELAKAIFN